MTSQVPLQPVQEYPAADASVWEGSNDPTNKSAPAGGKYPQKVQQNKAGEVGTY